MEESSYLISKGLQFAEVSPSETEMATRTVPVLGYLPHLKDKKESGALFVFADTACVDAMGLSYQKCF
jgi:hypothetical protein